MSDSVDGRGIITGIIVVAVDALSIIDGAIDVIVDAFAGAAAAGAAAAAAARDFERANFGARPLWGFVRFVFVFVEVLVVGPRWHSENSSSSSLVVVLNEIKYIRLSYTTFICLSYKPGQAGMCGWRHVNNIN